MTVESYLNRLATQSVIRDAEKVKIQASINSIKTKLKLHFGHEAMEVVVFGSYTRGTILPRSMDENSDIDIMVVFESGFGPQTYLDRLRRFVEKYYQRSEIKQSNPTIVLSLNHIKFEIVPAIRSFWSGLQIPAKPSDFSDWLDTDPNGFNKRLTAANQSYGSKIKPIIRLLKYWNAQNGHPFDSYELEQEIAGIWFVNDLLGLQRLEHYFFSAFESLEFGVFAPNWKKSALERGQSLAWDIRVLKKQGRESDAENKLKKLLPPTGGLLLAG